MVKPTALVGAALSAIPIYAAAWGPSQGQQYGGSSWKNWNPTQTLPQSHTNGASTWGTLAQAPIGPWMDGPMPQGSPWGGATCSNTNPYGSAPNTGMTRYYNWVVSNMTLAPDGVSIPMLVANGQFPGPLIEANWGDWIEVKVTNNFTTEGTSIHWHGFLMTGTPYMDGVPGVSQCPIAPGKSFTYRFRAELYGTSWWHSHYSAQYINGLAGPIVIHGPKSADYDIDLGPVMLSDWYHGYYQNLVYQVYRATPVGPIFPPGANTMLINGKSNYNCSNAGSHPCVPNAGLSQFRFQSGKKHLLRLINHGSEGIQFFSIDGYNMTVIANDFVPVEPYVTDLVTLSVGQRTDVVVEAIGKPTDAVWMRTAEGDSGLAPAGQAGCSLNDRFQTETTAAIYYEEADTSKAPTTHSQISPQRLLFPVACRNQPIALTKPAYPIAVKTPDVTTTIVMSGNWNASGDFVWTMNNQTYLANYNDPNLLEAKLGNTNFAPIRNVYNYGSNTSVRLILYNDPSGPPASHPMHLHGHNFQVLAEGPGGTWDGTITNPDNPQRRDTHIVAPFGWAVIQFDLDNPGTWPFHCHVAWHVSEGMNLILLEQEASVLREMELPYIMAQTCRDWAAYTGQNVVDQIDSGL